MLAFQFGRDQERRLDPSENRKVAEAIAERLQKGEGRVRWLREPIDEFTQKREHFDERRYLHPFARRVLARQVLMRLDDLPGCARSHDGGSQRYWPLDLGLAGTSSAGGEELTDLRWTDAWLHLFDIGIGILTLEVEGELRREDLLRFHEQFRRVGRSFTGQPLPRYVCVSGGVFRPLFDDPDQRHPVPDGEDPSPVQENKLVHWIMGGEILALAEEGACIVEPVLDERMLIQSWVAAPEEVGLDDGMWRALLWVDSVGGGSSNAPDPFVVRLQSQAEYLRWWQDHRIGFTRYSAMFFGRQSDNFFRDVVRRHCKGVYYTLAVLTLAHRAGLLSYTNASARLAEQIASSDANERRLLGSVQALRRAFLYFSTHYWFTELSHQDQGIEMSRLWSNAIGNRELFGEVRDEIDRFDAWQSQRSADENGRRLERMTWLLGSLTLWVGVLGANIKSLETALETSPWSPTAISLAASVALVYGVTRVPLRPRR